MHRAAQPRPESETMTAPSILRRTASGIAAIVLVFSALAGCSGGTQGTDGDTYYIFGSHRVWAKSTDLVNWETFESNLSTDVPRMLGKDADLTRYMSQKDTDVNVIAPCAKTDENGDMWMIKLDPATGLRDYSTTYETVEDQSGARYGIKLAGGFGNSGEASYLIKTNGYWHLFVSYGNLQQTGGYQIRVFRSENITGPHVDQAGNNWQSEDDIRLVSSIQWSGNDNGDIEVAQGHNSALVDDDGTMYLVYHTRFSDRGEEHEVRIHGLMPTSESWLVAAPYERTGSKADTAGYDASEIAGDHELVVHEQTTSFKGPKKVTDTDTDTDSTDYRGVNKPVNITPHEDGMVSGDHTGTWEAEDGSNRMTITLDSVAYTGDFVRMPRDVDHKEVMGFSALGDNLCIWGSQV